MIVETEITIKIKEVSTDAWETVTYTTEIEVPTCHFCIDKAVLIAYHSIHKMLHDLLTSKGV